MLCAMSGESSSSHASGTLSLPQFTAGAMHHMDCKVELDDGRTWSVQADTRTRLGTVLDESGQALGWTETGGKGTRQVVLPGGVQAPVFFQDKLFSRLVWIGDTSFKAVMMLEGPKRVFGDDRIRLEHRDFHSEVRFLCLPELLVPAVLVAFEVYARPSIGNSRR